MTSSGHRLITALLLGLLLLLLFSPALDADVDPLDQARAYIDEQRYAEAVELVAPLASEGHSGAQNILGILYAQGWGVDQDLGKAREWLEKSAAGGSAHAYFNLAYMYATGNGVEKDCGKAVELWLTPAEQGDPVAQVNVGSLYADGSECTPQDFDEAIRWYRLAAEQNDPVAQHSIGAIHAMGAGVEQSYEKAREWYEKAAAQGYADSQATLGWMYFAGEGVEPDLDKAREWYEKAAAQGNERAIQGLAAIDKRTTFGSVDQMVETYLAASAKDVALESISLATLSQMLDFGFTVIMDGLEINDANREMIRAEVDAKRDAIGRAVEIRGVADIAGTYRAEASSACSKIQSGWADGTRQGFLGDPTFEQSGHEVTMIQLADFDGGQPMETPVIIVENVLAFSDMMNTDFPFTGIMNGNVITIRPETDRILAAWPDWVKAPSRRNLDKCKVTLTRE